MVYSEDDVANGCDDLKSVMRLDRLIGCPIIVHQVAKASFMYVVAMLTCISCSISDSQQADVAYSLALSKAD